MAVKKKEYVMQAAFFSEVTLRDKARGIVWLKDLAGNTFSIAENVFNHSFIPAGEILALLRSIESKKGGEPHR